jgi:hypothetical protein
MFLLMMAEQQPGALIVLRLDRAITNTGQAFHVNRLQLYCVSTICEKTFSGLIRF